MRSFITGSHVYGTPREDSDLDLVVLVDGLALDNLKATADEVVEKAGDTQTDPGPMSASLRFGKLNLIAVTDEAAFAVWRLGTAKLVRECRGGERPVSRERACKLFKMLRDKPLARKDD